MEGDNYPMTTTADSNIANEYNPYTSQVTEGTDINIDTTPPVNIATWTDSFQTTETSTPETKYKLNDREIVNNNRTTQTTDFIKNTTPVFLDKTNYTESLTNTVVPLNFTTFNEETTSENSVLSTVDGSIEYFSTEINTYDLTTSLELEQKSSDEDLFESRSTVLPKNITFSTIIETEETTTVLPLTSIDISDLETNINTLMESTPLYIEMNNEIDQTTIEYDELTHSSSTIHFESTLKPVTIKSNEINESISQNENKNTKTPENQRQLNNFTQMILSFKTSTKEPQELKEMTRIPTFIAVNPDDTTNIDVTVTSTPSVIINNGNNKYDITSTTNKIIITKDFEEKLLPGSDNTDDEFYNSALSIYGTTNSPIDLRGSQSGFQKTSTTDIKESNFNIDMGTTFEVTETISDIQAPTSSYLAIITESSNTDEVKYTLSTIPTYYPTASQYEDVHNKNTNPSEKETQSTNLSTEKDIQTSKINEIDVTTEYMKGTILNNIDTTTAISHETESNHLYKNEEDMDNSLVTDDGIPSVTELSNPTIDISKIENISTTLGVTTTDTPNVDEITLPNSSYFTNKDDIKTTLSSVSLENKTTDTTVNNLYTEIVTFRDSTIFTKEKSTTDIPLNTIIDNVNDKTKEYSYDDTTESINTGKNDFQVNYDTSYIVTERKPTIGTLFSEDYKIQSETENTTPLTINFDKNPEITKKTFDESIHTDKYFTHTSKNTTTIEGISDVTLDSIYPKSITETDQTSNTVRSENVFTDNTVTNNYYYTTSSHISNTESPINTAKETLPKSEQETSTQYTTPLTTTKLYSTFDLETDSTFLVYTGPSTDKTKDISSFNPTDYTTEYAQKTESIISDISSEEFPTTTENTTIEDLFEVTTQPHTTENIKKPTTLITNTSKPFIYSDISHGTENSILPYETTTNSFLTKNNNDTMDTTKKEMFITDHAVNTISQESTDDNLTDLLNMFMGNHYTTESNNLSNDVTLTEINVNTSQDIESKLSKIPDQQLGFTSSEKTESTLTTNLEIATKATLVELHSDLIPNEMTSTTVFYDYQDSTDLLSSSNGDWKAEYDMNIGTDTSSQSTTDVGSQTTRYPIDLYIVKTPLTTQMDAALMTTEKDISQKSTANIDFIGNNFESTVENIVTVSPTGTTNKNQFLQHETSSASEELVTDSVTKYISSTFVASTLTDIISETEQPKLSADRLIPSTQEYTTESMTTTKSRLNLNDTINTPIPVYLNSDISMKKNNSFVSVSTSTENLSSRSKDVDIFAWTESTTTTDLTSTEIYTSTDFHNKEKCDLNSQCPMDNACMNGVCQNPCEVVPSPCTLNTPCNVVDRAAVCVCDHEAGDFCRRGMLDKIFCIPIQTCQQIQNIVFFLIKCYVEKCYHMAVLSDKCMYIRPTV